MLSEYADVAADGRARGIGGAPQAKMARENNIALYTLTCGKTLRSWAIELAARRECLLLREHDVPLVDMIG